MNISNPVIGSFSIFETSLEWLLVTASLCMLVSLSLAWLATLIVYGRVRFLKAIFPVPHNLVRAHIDYRMMASLLGVAYFACLFLLVELPSLIVVLLCLGVIYNPIGFIVQANNPKAGKSDNPLTRFFVCIGFLPTTIGFGYTFIVILARLMGQQ